MWRVATASRVYKGVAFCVLLLLVPAFAMGQVWNYRYDAIGNTGTWAWGTTDRFRYDYAGTQWYDRSGGAVWNKLGAVGFSAVTVGQGANPANFVGNGAWHTVGTGLSYIYASSGDFSNWLINGNMRYAYTYSTGQWADYYWGTNTWSRLGSAGTSSAFLGDGAWHTVGTGLSYKYFSAGDYDNWMVNGSLRFAYTYGSGLWADYYRGTTTWGVLGSGGVSSAFIGDGGWHTVATGLSYRYASAGDYSNWLINGNMRFAYTYGTGQWADYYWGTNTWSLLGSGGISSTFLGDGAWHTVGTGLSYKYMTSGDYSNWMVNGSLRFAYTYGAGQWADYYRATTTWSLLGSAGLASAFIGDGAWHGLGNGWDYSYAANTGTWAPTGTLTGRFAYDYLGGQWFDTSAFTTGWAALSALGLSSAFVGDGTSHSLGNGWNYTYAANTGTWAPTGGVGRFAYDYVGGQWSDTSAFTTGWLALSALGQSAAFVGDGTTHSLGNGWDYSYASNAGTWAPTGSAGLFEYDYSSGQWFDTSAFTAGWAALSGLGQSAAFVGDGTTHSLGNGWDYTYAAYTGTWAPTGAAGLFLYDYLGGQWSDTSAFTTGWVALSAQFQSADFVGDGATHNVGNGWDFTYAADTGTWATAGTGVGVYQYAYLTGQWYQPAPGSGWSPLGAPGSPVNLPGGTTWQDLGNGWTYLYIAGGNYGLWQGSDGVVRFRYDYGPGQWSDYYAGTNTWSLLGSAGQTSTFIGDGLWHQMGTVWSYQYNFGTGSWRDTAGRFAYNYDTGQWYDSGYDGRLNILGAAGLASAFLGDGAWHSLGLVNGSDWQFMYTSGVGTWQNNLGTGWNDRFQYTFGTGQWGEKSPFDVVWASLGANHLSSAFLGSGDYRTLGNGWYYRYASDEAFWSATFGGQARFSYVYGAGQFYDWSGANKFALDAAGTESAAFMGDGGWHDVTLAGGKTWYYQYNYGLDEGFWGKSAGANKFGYKYAGGQWFDFAPVGGVYQLGSSSMSALFIGDETAHDLLDNKWKYTYAYDVDEGSWSRVSTGQTRFSYNYGGGQWYEHDSTTRYAMGASQAAAVQFIGDGISHDLGVWPTVTGAWSFQYDYGNDTGKWGTGLTGPVRFAYAYGSGQWSQGNTLGLFAIGNAGATAVFLGDGVAHDVTTTPGSNWWFTYAYGADTGSWSKTAAGTYRFAYDYANTKWTDNAPSGAYQLGDSTRSASFIGDGTAHALNGTWKYTYTYGPSEAGAWLNIVLNQKIYSYDYAGGQWYHYDGATPYALMAASQPASTFVGDGQWHDVSTGGRSWWYRFDGSQSGQYAQASGGTPRFGYDYKLMAWNTYGATGAALKLGTLRLNTWVGDEQPHALAGGWQFTYAYSADKASFVNAGVVTQFAYDYGPGQWWHTYGGTPYTLGNAGNAVGNAYFDGGIYAITIGTLNEKYQFVKGNIGGYTDREVGYYYGASGTSTSGPNLAFSYFATGATDNGSWALIQKTGTTYVRFTEAGLNPGTRNFADGNYYTTFTGQWASAKFDPTGTGKVYFELASQDGAVAKEHLYYDKAGDQWYDEWRYQPTNPWVAMTGGFWYGSAKFMATNLASGRVFNFAQSPTGTNPMTVYFGDSVTTATWSNLPAELTNHILFSARSFYDYTTYNWWNGPPAAWYHQTNPGPIVSPGNYYVR
jgi:hypothetical protein